MKYIFLAVCAISLGGITGCSEKKPPLLEDNNVYLEEDEVEREISKFKASVHGLLYAEKYAELNKLAEANLENKLRFGDGEWCIRILNDGLFEPSPSSESEWDSAEGKIKEWVAQYPLSVSARAAYVQCLKNRAWFYRGGKWAREVPKNA